jgi:hypothetical protein
MPVHIVGGGFKIFGQDTKTLPEIITPLEIIQDTGQPAVDRAAGIDVFLFQRDKVQ